MNFRQHLPVGMSYERNWQVWADLVDLDGTPLYQGELGWIAGIIQDHHYQLIQVNGNTLPTPEKTS
jgi:hypothetical protein